MRVIGFFAALSVLSVGCRTHSLSDDPCHPPHQILVRRVVPPAKNPYPPTSAQDVSRVALASESLRIFWGSQLQEAALRERLKQPHDPAADDQTKGPGDLSFQDKPLACLRDVNCWSKDYPFLQRVVGHASLSPPFVVRKLHYAFVVPWSMRRYEERSRPAAERSVTDDFRIVQAQTADFQNSGEPLAFTIPVPKLRADEYLVDALVEIDQQPGYFHVIHVVSDNAQGEPVLRWFDLVPIQDLTRWSCNP